MSCQVSYYVSRGPGQVVRKGQEPRKPADWDASAWLVLPGGERHTHSAKVHQKTLLELVPYMNLLIETLIEDHGKAALSAGWSAASHGSKKPKRKRK